MLDRADAIFKLALAFAAVCLGLGIGYYYGIFLPGQITANSERTASLDRERAERERDALSKKSAANLAAKEKYDTCIADAAADYTARWNATCRTFHNAEIKRKASCLEQGLDADYCASFVAHPATDCQLSAQTAESYDEGHQRAKQLCLDEMKVTQS